MTEYVYLLQCAGGPERIPHALYIGYTKNYERRLYAHSHNWSDYTAKFTEYDFVLVLKMDSMGLAFEKYLKKFRSQTRAIAQNGLWTFGNADYWQTTRGLSLKRKLLKWFLDANMEVVIWNPKKYIPLK